MEMYLTFRRRCNQHPLESSWFPLQSSLLACWLPLHLSFSPHLSAVYHFFFTLLIYFYFFHILLSGPFSPFQSNLPVQPLPLSFFSDQAIVVQEQASDFISTFCCMHLSVIIKSHSQTDSGSVVSWQIMQSSESLERCSICRCEVETAIEQHTNKSTWLWKLLLSHHYESGHSCKM